MKTEDIVKYALIAVGGYLVWVYVLEPLFNQTTAAAGTAPATGTAATTGTTGTSTATVPIPVTIPAQATVPSPIITSNSGPGIPQSHMAAQLQAANTTGSLTLNADQWNFYWNQLGLPAVPNAIFTSAFFPNGRPANAVNNPTMTAGSFYTALANAGMTGLSGVGDILMVPQNAGMGNVGFRRKKVNGFGGNPGRVSQVVN
jgi:hypothetical protein